MIVLPTCAGLLALLREKSEFWMAGAPLFRMKTPGPAIRTGTVTGLLTAPLTWTVTVAVPGGVSHGTWKLIRLGCACRRGASCPLTLTVKPPKLVGKGGWA